MSDNKFKGTYRIPSARAQWHDYEGGEYFVTICTQNREHFFGEIVNGEMRLSEVGKMAEKCIQEVHNHFSNADVPLYVVMPNHVHIIIIIDRPNVETQNLASLSAETQNVASLSAETQNVASLQCDVRQGFGPQSKNLSSIVRGIKIGTTAYARRNNISFAWQARFHDRIIRDQEEMNRIAEYIENNVARWEYDGMNRGAL